jgi:hypothetical protein
MASSRPNRLTPLQRDLVRGFFERALHDATVKDAGVDPATLAWLVSEISISPEARLPGAADPSAVDATRRDLVKRLRGIAFAKTR